jgi:predicted ATPase
MNKNNFAKIIVVTHSDFVIFHLRRLVSENKIDFNFVEIYFIDENKNVIEIKIKQNGELFEWPIGFCDGEDFELRELFRNRNNVK